MRDMPRRTGAASAVRRRARRDHDQMAEEKPSDTAQSWSTRKICATRHLHAARVEAFPTASTLASAAGDQYRMRAQRASENARLQQASLCDDAIVLRVRADPEPQEPVRGIHCEGTVVNTDTRRMKAPDALEMQRRMSRVCLQQLELLVRESLGGGRQQIVARPETGRGVMSQSLRERPAA